MNITPDIENRLENNYNVTEGEMVNNDMSLVIMIKCSDGIVCGADSRSTFNDGTSLKSAGDVCKVFSNNNIIIGTFGINQVVIPSQYSSSFIKMVLKRREKIENVINRILTKDMTRDEFLGEFQKELIDDSNTFEFFIGSKDGANYKIDYIKISYKECICKEIESDIIMCKTNYSYNDPVITKKVSLDRGKEIVKEMIETTKYLQSELLEYQNVAGNIIIKTLK